MSAEESSSGPTLIPVAILLTLTCVLLLTAASPPDPCAVPADGPDDGMSLLQRAARAEDEVAYTGVRRISSAEHGGRTDLRVINRPGEGLFLAQLGEEDRGLFVRSSQALDSLDARMLAMLRDIYAVTDTGRTEFRDREAHLVETLRADGSVAGRFWVDTETDLLIGRTIYERDEEEAISTRLVELELGGDSRPEHMRADEPWGEVLDAVELDELRAQGWHVPEHLDWDLRLIDARSTHHGDHMVVHSVYSDGLSQISVFTQRGRLGTAHTAPPRNGYVGTDTDGPGISPQHDMIFGGDTGQYQSMWQANGFVYTVLADAPAELAASAVNALPEPETPGFWARVQRGLSRWGVL